jgi:predicted RNase H-like HicB family nuclease
MKNRYSFIATFHYAEDGISISFQDLPGCLPCASNTDEALKNAKEALGLHIWGMEQDNEDIPTPTPLEQIDLKHGEMPVLIEVFMPPIRDKVNNQFTKKTLSLPTWLAAEADAHDVNCSKIFQNALIDYLELEERRREQ